MLTRRLFLAGSAALTLPRPALATTLALPKPALTVASRQIEVLGRAATVYGITNAKGGLGLTAREGDRFSGEVLNLTGEDLILHWHGQTLASNTDDLTRPGGGVQPQGTALAYDFALTPGTHWMHSHTLSEQTLLAAPMVTVEADATTPEAVVMLHDFTFRSPAEILHELGASGMHDMGAMAMDGTQGGAHSGSHGGTHDMGAMDMGGMDMGGMAMPGMTHANDVAYDAYLANDRSLDDPQVIEVSPGPFRLRIINGATATAFWLDTGLPTQVIATDGIPCLPLTGQNFPIAMGQRLDLMVTIPPEGGAFPILAQVESARMRTGVILATRGAPIARIAGTAEADAAPIDLRLDAALTARNPPPARAARMLHLNLGMQPGYVWTIQDGAPLQAALGERVELMFMNPTMMMHPMHLHGHHFQVVDVGRGRFNGPMRDTVIVPPGGMVTVAVDFDKPGEWYLHCHHLYHMAGGMMTSVQVA